MPRYSRATANLRCVSCGIEGSYHGRNVDEGRSNARRNYGWRLDPELCGGCNPDPETPLWATLTAEGRETWRKLMERAREQAGRQRAA